MSFQFSFPALGTVWWLEITRELSETESHSLTTGVTFLLSEFEAKYSRFKENSLISHLNKDGVLDSPDNETIEILRLGQRLCTETDGLFNPLVGAHLVARGYDANYSFKPSAEPSTFSSPHTDLEVSKDKIILKNGSLDLGGYGKGYALDMLAKYLKEEFGEYDFLINAGGDIITSNKSAEPWEIYLEHPLKDKTYLGKITLENKAFASSSPHKRRWKVGDKTYTHIVDTANTTEKPDASFVIAETALKADVLGTVLLIAPPTQYNSLLNNFEAVAALVNLEKNTLTSLHNFPKILPI